MAPNRKTTSAQVAALMEYMQEHGDMAKIAMSNTADREDIRNHWADLTVTLNNMGGAIKSVDKWKQTWRDLKLNTKKRALKQQQSSLCDTSVGPGVDPSQNDTDSEMYVPPKKKASFDEEIVRIEREKLDLDREYKAQKIEVLSRIASALEEISKKKDKT